MAGPITPQTRRGRLAIVAALAALFLVAGTARAGASILRPPAGQTFFGVSDTGNPADFTAFTDAVGKHPAVSETFLDFGHSLTGAVGRWRDTQTRPILHITTADSHDRHELITPRQIAQGQGDSFLLKVNSAFATNAILGYVRPLGEPNRCLNPYTAIDCSGHRRGGDHTYYWYKQAFRRFYVIAHGGGTLADINARLAATGLPPIATPKPPAALPAASIAVIWSPLPGGSPRVNANLPAHYYPGDAYTDWVGTDIYSNDVNWNDVQRTYRRFPGKPFAFAEWGVLGADAPLFVKHVFSFVRTKPRCRMLVYYQDFGASNPYRIQNYPRSLAVVRRNLLSPRFPPFAAYPPPPGPYTG